MTGNVHCAKMPPFGGKKGGVCLKPPRYAFIASGCAALIRQWFSTGMRETPETIASFTRGLIDNLLTVATKKK